MSGRTLSALQLSLRYAGNAPPPGDSGRNSSRSASETRAEQARLQQPSIPEPPRPLHTRASTEPSRAEPGRAGPDRARPGQAGPFGTDPRQGAQRGSLLHVRQQEGTGPHHQLGQIPAGLRGLGLIRD